MIPKSNCPHCNHELWDNDPILQPEKGNYMCCMYCGGVGIFTKNLRVVIPKRIPEDVECKSRIIKLALKVGVSVEQIVKDSLIKDGHIKSH